MVNWIRKGLALTLALSCMLFLEACGGGSSAGDGEGGAPASASAPATFSLEEQELYNENGIVLRCMGGALESGHYNVDLEVENVDAAYREVTIEGIAFNGLYLPCTSVMSFVDKGETGEPDVDVEKSVVERAGIESIDAITILFSMHDGEYNFETKNLPLDIEVASASGDGSYAITASDDVVFDGDDVVISYQGSEVAEDGSFRAYFLMNNASDKAHVVRALGDPTVSGGAGDALYVSLMSPQIPAGSSALVALECQSGESGSSDFDTIDMKVQVSTDEYDISAPLHLERSGDELTVKGGEPEYPANYGKDSSAAKDSTTSAEAGADPDKAEDLELVTCGFFSEARGSSGDAWSSFGICAVDNPNDDLWAYSFDIVFTFLDEAGNEVGTKTQPSMSLEPGYAHPFLSGKVDTNVPVASVEARIENAKFVAEREGLYKHNDSMRAVDIKVGSDGKAISSTMLVGTIENAGEAADDAQVVLVLYDKDSVPVYGYSFRVADIPAQGSVDFEERLGINLELPAYDSATIDIMTR